MMIFFNLVFKIPKLSLNIKSTQIAEQSANCRASILVKLDYETLPFQWATVWHFEGTIQGSRNGWSYLIKIQVGFSIWVFKRIAIKKSSIFLSNREEKCLLGGQKIPKRLMHNIHRQINTLSGTLSTQWQTAIYRQTNLKSSFAAKMIYLYQNQDHSGLRQDFGHLLHLHY